MRIRSIALSLVLCAVAGVAYADESVPTAVPVTVTPSVESPIPSTTLSRSTSPTPRKLQPQSVTITLLDGMKLAGELTEVDQWSMKTSFGTTNLPLSTVAGMKMAHEGDSMTTVVLHNGDNLTGAVQLDLVVIQTEWGRAEINGNHIASILFTPGLKWSSETGLNGMRWKLVTDEPPKTAPAPGTPGAQPVPGQQVRPQQPVNVQYRQYRQ